ncbi:unnamed protein product [Cylindrotheca closterium]|uniref:Mitochondrial carrier protein n=1 Tax=Cylindrotheca closterium TaxID=2856 RepID=A0AAD2GCX9_9STRA|nr:unnamed protein product [Cylindrotheca closterium]
MNISGWPPSDHSFIGASEHQSSPLPLPLPGTATQDSQKRCKLKRMASLPYSSLHAPILETMRANHHTGILAVALLLLCLPLIVTAKTRARARARSRVRATVTSPVFARGGEQRKVGPLQTFLSTVKDARQHLMAAAVARGTCTAIMYPMDLIKTRIQVSHPNPLQLEGLFDGLGGSLLGQIPYGVLTFGSYEVYKRTLQERFPDWKPAFQYALAAIMGDMTGSFWLCPSEVVKNQIQAGMYKTTPQAYRSILNSKGFGGFYQGFFGLAARDIPFRVCQLTSYEIVKSVYLKSKTAKNLSQQRQRQRQRQQRGKDQGQAEVALSPVESAICGAIAGTFSAAVTTPLDRIKTLMAVSTETSAAAAGVSSSVFACASMIIKEEGPLGLLKGLVPRVVYVAPSVTIFFIVYEAAQQRFKSSDAFQPDGKTAQKSKRQ